MMLVLWWGKANVEEAKGRSFAEDGTRIDCGK